MVITSLFEQVVGWEVYANCTCAALGLDTSAVSRFHVFKLESLIEEISLLVLKFPVIQSCSFVRPPHGNGMETVGVLPLGNAE